MLASSRPGTRGPSRTAGPSAAGRDPAADRGAHGASVWPPSGVALARVPRGCDLRPWPSPRRAGDRSKHPLLRMCLGLSSSAHLVWRLLDFSERPVPGGLGNGRRALRTSGPSFGDLHPISSVRAPTPDSVTLSLPYLKVVLFCGKCVLGLKSWWKPGGGTCGRLRAPEHPCSLRRCGCRRAIPAPGPEVGEARESSGSQCRRLQEKKKKIRAASHRVRAKG